MNKTWPNLKMLSSKFHRTMEEIEVSSIICGNNYPVPKSSNSPIPEYSYSFLPVPWLPLDLISLSPKFGKKLLIRKMNEKAEFELSTKRNYVSLFYHRKKEVNDDDPGFLYALYTSIPFTSILLNKLLHYQQTSTHSMVMNATQQLHKQDKTTKGFHKRSL